MGGRAEGRVAVEGGDASAVGLCGEPTGAAYDVRVDVAGDDLAARADGVGEKFGVVAAGSRKPAGSRILKVDRK